MPQATDCWISDVAWYPCTHDRPLRVGRSQLPPGPATTRSLLKFDVQEAIPDVATVDLATLELTPSGTNEGLNVDLHAVTRDWNPDLVTWTHADTGEPWSAPGGDFNQLPAYSVIDAGTETDECEVTSIVSSWVSGAENFGLLIKASDETEGSIQYVSARDQNNAGIPKLFIEWSIPPETIHVVPIFECVERNIGGGYSAYFGYENLSTDETGNLVDVSIEVGTRNSIAPASYEAVLPEEYVVPQIIEGRPGRTPPGATDQGAFVIEYWDGTTTVEWTLQGRSAIANVNVSCSDVTHSVNSHARIQTAFDRGDIDLVDAAEAQMLALVDSPALPIQFRRQAGDAPAEFPLNWYSQAFAQMSVAEREQVAESLGFPDSPATNLPEESRVAPTQNPLPEWSDCLQVTTMILYLEFSCEVIVNEGDAIVIVPPGPGAGPGEIQISPADFKILFNVGGDEVEPISTKQTGRPDIVFEVIAEAVHAMNYFADRGYDTPNDFIVLITSHVHDDRGFATPSIGMYPGIPWHRVPGFVGLNASPVPDLVHHEIFHQIQYEYAPFYRVGSDYDIHWWMEATARWAQHQLQDRSSSPYAYAANLPDFLGTPHYRLDLGFDLFDLGDRRKYGSFIVAEYLDTISPSDEAIRLTWDSIRNWNSPISSIRERMFYFGR